MKSLSIRTQVQINLLLTLCGCQIFAAHVDPKAVRKAATFYASFDESVAGDYGRGKLMPSTRFDHKTEKGKFVFKPGIDENIFQIAKGKGIRGSALKATDVLPRRGRIFFPGKGNIGFKPDGWSGTISLWLNTDPNTMLKTRFCDPIQITAKNAHNGGLWLDFPDVRPRDFRLGAFRGLDEGEKAVRESDPAAPLVRVKSIGFKSGDWHHVAVTWENFDTGKNNARATLYIDGKNVGELRNLDIAMKWDLDETGIYFAVSYIGLLDELSLFDRPLSPAELTYLRKNPNCLADLKDTTAANTRPNAEASIANSLRRKPKGEAPAVPKFPFDTNKASKHQQLYAQWLGIPVEFATSTGMKMRLVPPGKFVMGSPDDEPGHATSNYDETQHPVELTQPFYISKFETTVRQFREFVEETKYKTDGEKNGGGNAHDEKAVWKHRPGTSWLKPGYAGPFTMRGEHPVVHVSHADCKAFCHWLGEQSNENLEYDLPTEAQWEWACRAGSPARFWWGEDVDSTGKVINVGDQTLKRVHPEWPRETMPMNDGYAFPAPVGSYRPNGFGLHDLLGNVWEFCSTRYGPYPHDLDVDPGDLDPRRGFAVRGGGWSNKPNDTRCATRNADPPHFCHSNLGFRVAIKLNLDKLKLESDD